MTTADVMELRREIGFRSPIRPMERGDKPWVLFAQRGVYEFALHVDDAIEVLARGGFWWAGTWLSCSAVDVLALQNAIQVRALDPDRETGFVAA